jgi:transglutaminase-like putative cysteine protease
MRLFILLFLLLVTIGAGAQQNYDASLISKDLLPYASAVVRNEQVTVTVNDLDNVTYHIKKAITVLNKNGDDMGGLNLVYNKSNIIKNVKGTIYDSFGKPTVKFSESDFEDVYGYDGISIFDDARVKYYRPHVADYPYTVEYEYEQRSKQTLYFDDWIPNNEFGMAVENSTYTFKCKSDFNIRYKEINIPEQVSTGTENSFKTYNWHINNLKAVRNEPLNPNPQNYLSQVKIAPENFEYEYIKGRFTDWNSLGRWIYDDLLANRQQVSPETVQHIMDITAGITDPKLKAKKIYEYMQSKTRYVSVQVGIGGFQPFLASDVDKLDYGDCKALVNYTQALLKVAGIDSYYCVVEAGREYKIGLLSDFADMNQGDHIILCLPFKNDTTWADCTSQTIPFGYLGSFTDDRNVLACTPEGGKLMHTPKYTAAINLEHRKAGFTIDETGQLSGEMTSTFTGVPYEFRDEVISESQVDRIKSIKNEYPINNMNVEKLEFQQDKSFNPVTTEYLKLHAPEYASANDGKLVFLVNAADRDFRAPREVRNRATDIYINEGYTNEDEVVYTLPQGYHLDSAPLDVELDKPFGHFSATMKIEGNQLIYKRRLQVIDGTYPKDTYPDLVDFYQDVVDADAYDVTLVKN